MGSYTLVYDVDLVRYSHKREALTPHGPSGPNRSAANRSSCPHALQAEKIKAPSLRSDLGLCVGQGPPFLEVELVQFVWDCLEIGKMPKLGHGGCREMTGSERLALDAAAQGLTTVQEWGMDFFNCYQSIQSQQLVWSVTGS